MISFSSFSLCSILGASVFALPGPLPVTSRYLVPQDSVKSVHITITAKEIAAHSIDSMPRAQSSSNTVYKASGKRKDQKPAAGPVQRQLKTNTAGADAVKQQNAHTQPPAHRPALPEPGINKQLVYPGWLLAGTALLALGLAGAVILYQGKRIENAGIMHELHKAAERANALDGLSNFKSKLFAIVGHDLRSPIGNLRAMMELFQDKRMSESEMAEGLREMLPAVENADLIICNLLNWAVNQMNGLKLNKTDFSFNTVVEETLSSFTFLLEAKQIGIRNNTYTEPFIFADIDLVRIIVRNMVSNAVKFSMQGGQIKFQSSSKDGKVILSVTDNGIGISQEELKGLFLQAHAAKNGTKGEKGAGIGLMLCQELALLNNGKITASSIPGQYCTFSLELPRSTVR